MKKLFLALGLAMLCSTAFAKTNSVTVTVKKIEGFSESGDAFTFKTTSGKRYQVYNAGVRVLFRVRNIFLIQSKLKNQFV